jgi:hypothetical protein
MSAWSNKYRDSRWQKKRLAVMERDGFACRSCGKEGEDCGLTVHHSYYEAGKAPWEYPDETLLTVCEECHEGRHLLNRCVSVAIAHMDFKYAKRIAGMIARESHNLRMLAECEAAGVPCGDIENTLKFLIKNRGVL